MMVRLRDERGILGLSLIRWLVVIVLLGLVVIEGGSIIFTTIGLQNAADGAAVAAVDKWRETKNIQLARAVIRQSLDDAEQDDARITELEADGFPPFELRVTVQKKAATLIVQHIGFLEDFGRVDVTAKARPVQSDI